MTLAELETRLTYIRQSPSESGRLELIVSRPRTGAREVQEEGALDSVHGLLGDNWSTRGSSRMPKRASDPRRQITIMNVRAIEVVGGGRDQWPLAGDQLFVDFDLSESNAPAGTQIQIGTAIVEVTEPPHRGCYKFTARFGADATAFVNSKAGVLLNLRGINARVVRNGTLRVGDPVTKVKDPASSRSPIS